MMKLKILNLDGFLETIGRCRGPVYQVGPDGSRTDLCRSASLQDALRARYCRDRGELSITLVVPDGHDFFRIVAYYTGDC